jgi:hypothetical protein
MLSYRRLPPPSAPPPLLNPSAAARKAERAATRLMSRPIRFEPHVQTVPEYMYEMVADVTGIAIPALLQSKGTKRESAVLSFAVRHCTVAAQKLRLVTIAETFARTGDIPVADMLFASAVYSSCLSGYHFKPAQIVNYDWLRQDMVDAAIAYMRSVGISEDAAFEVELVGPLDGSNVVVKGRVDAMTEEAVFEVKCCASGFMREHLLQLALYAWLVSRQPYAGDATHRRFLLVYVCTREVYELDYDADVLERVSQRRLAVKTADRPAQLSDAEFITAT